MATRTYQDEFNRWTKKEKVELFPKLSDVVTQYRQQLEIGQKCTFRNDCFIDFPGHTIMGFCEPMLSGSCVYLDYDCYWMPAHPDNILLDETNDHLCNIEVTQVKDCTILIINRVHCVLQSYIKDDYVNISPVQSGMETFDYRLDNVRVDFGKETITTDGKRSNKWHNFTRTIDIGMLKEVIQTLQK